jgi:hypothetical protein
MPDPDSAFDDSDQLSQTLQDAKISDTVAVSSASDASQALQNFGLETATSPWTTLDRGTVASRLEQLVADSRQTQQGALNLCGPAAFFSQWIRRDPVAFANYAIALYDKGAGQIGTLTVAPGSDLIASDYSQMVQKMGNNISPAADWLALGALRNSTDVFWQGSFTGDPSQGLSAMTRPGELASWFTATGIYNTVDNQANWMTCAGIAHALNLSLLPGTDIALLIHMNLINASQGDPVDTSWLMNQFPNHWVVLLGPVIQAVMGNPAGTPVARGVQSTNSAAPQAGDILLTIWSWGKVLNLRVPAQTFYNYYFGAIIAKLPPVSTAQ